jgi:hypothetical protein
LRNVDAVFLGTRGLVFVAPIVIVAIGAAVWLVRNGARDERRHAAIGLLIVAAYLVLCAGWSGTPLLEEPGPRYAIPALPFLVVPLAAVWDRIVRVALVAAATGAVPMAAAAFTFILLPVGAPAGRYLAYAGEGRWSPTLWSIALGDAGVVCHVLSIVATGVLCRRAATRRAVPTAGTPPLARARVPDREPA